MFMRKCLYVSILLQLSWSILLGQERVYVSTDKDIYVAGEDIWYSVYCLDGEKFSGLSDVAYLQFVSNDGVAGTSKVALIDGRGCGRFRIPASFATGNYSIVSYTKCYGGDAKGEFNGKIISVFNTLSSAKVKDGVIDGKGAGAAFRNIAAPSEAASMVKVEVCAEKDGAVPVKIINSGSAGMRLSVSVYHADKLEELSGSYNKTSLLERTGDFWKVDEVDYAGEVVTVRVNGKDGSSAAGKYLYMSGVGNTKDVYVNRIGEDGLAVFHTGNIFGKRDLVFEVLADSKSVAQGTAARDTSMAYDVEIVEKEYRRLVAEIPPLEITPAMERGLRERGRRMQISRRFDADTLWDMGAKKDNSFAGNTPPLVYNLDEYTRFQNLEEVLREYVDYVRVRRIGGSAEIKVLWETQGRCLALLDGIPVSDHSVILGLAQQLVKQIVVYPKRYMLNNFIYDGVVNFITYKGDMGGIRLPKNVSVVEFDGVSWPVALLGTRVASEKDYPNFLSTIYWNPTVEIPAGGTFELRCILPQYKGKFRVVVEGLSDSFVEIYAAGEFGN